MCGRGIQSDGVPLIVKDSYMLEGTLKEVTPGSVAECWAMALGRESRDNTKTLESVLDRIHTST